MKQALNETEEQVLKALIQQVTDCTGDEFGYMEDVSRCGLSKHQFAGYIGSLEQKDAFEFIGGDVAGQYILAPEYFDYFK